MANDIIATITGNIVADAELRFTPSGAAVASFTVASTPRAYDRQTQEWRDGDTTFVRCSVWRTQAENAAESLVKGTRVICAGKLYQRAYEKDGQTRYSLDMQVDEVGASLLHAVARVERRRTTTNDEAPF